tara:strand:+ start:11213 stop:12130 length:918 start_codon:yes stop_codon:yes gene_type:complete
MWYKKIKLALLTIVVLCGCTSDIGVTTQVVEEITPPTTVVVDSLIQPSPPEKLDIIVVLDTSGSMSDNYTQLSAGIELLRQDIETITLDYRFAFINSSLYSSASTVYYAGHYDIASTSIDFLLAPYLLAPETYEIGFMGLYNFVNNAPEAFTFFREDADKLIIFVSDEEEQSIIPVPVMREFLTDRFAAVQHDVVAIITTEQSDCETSSMASIGHKYIDLLAYYGKMGTDICSDWELWLANSSFLVGDIQHINLSQTPVEESIVVYADKIVTEQWYYLPETNTVYLDFIPRQGSLIEVGYVAITE